MYDKEKYNEEIIFKHILCYKESSMNILHTLDTIANFLIEPIKNYEVNETLKQINDYNIFLKRLYSKELCDLLEYGYLINKLIAKYNKCHNYIQRKSLEMNITNKYLKDIKYTSEQILSLMDISLFVFENTSIYSLIELNDTKLFSNEKKLMTKSLFDFSFINYSKMIKCISILGEQIKHFIY